MKKIVFLICTLFIAYGVSAQAFAKADSETKSTQGEDSATYFITHKVALGEKIIMISRKYMVDPKDIYEFNKDAVNGLTAGSVLMIPLHKSHKSDLPAFIKALEKERGGSLRVSAPPEKDQART